MNRRELRFIKYNMPRNYYFVCKEIHARITSVLTRVTEEDTSRGPQGEFLNERVIEVGIIETSESSKMLI